MSPIVVVDSKALTYARYVGKICTHKVQPAGPFSPQMIEEFRLDPVQFQSRFQIEGEEEQAEPPPAQA